MNVHFHTLKNYSRLAAILIFMVVFSGGIFSQDCCDQGDKPNSLTMVYTGESCAATNTTQQTDKYDCDDFNGGPSG